MEMLSLSDGSVEVIRDERDFSDMLDRKLGQDVRNWFDGFVKLYEDAVDEIRILGEGDDF